MRARPAPGNGARPTRRVIATAAAGALIAAGAATSTTLDAAASAPATGAADPTVRWVDCAELNALPGPECGLVRVPLDHDRPGGPTIEIAISRMKATVAPERRQGVMFVNPGGPGGSGLGLSSLRDVVPDGAGRAYDWIGFDPRGVGASRPSISCLPDYNQGPRPDYRPDPGTTATSARLSDNEKAWLKRSRSYAQACAKRNGPILRHMRTTDVAEDMDDIRRALNAKKINYYGFSYGSYLGQVYATMHPDRVRRMVLDGVVDADNVWFDAQLTQDRAFDKVATRFFAWIARHDEDYSLGTTAEAVSKRYYEILDDLVDNPADGEIGPAEWTDVFVSATYAESLWPRAAANLSAVANRGSSGDLVTLYEDNADIGDDNTFAVYNAVQCTDAPWPDTYRDGWRADGFATDADAPFLTWSNVWFNTACLFWPAPSHRPITIDGDDAPPMLLINTTGDGATPYAGALATRETFDRARLVRVTGSTTHTGSLRGNECLGEIIAAYLRTGELPERRSGQRPDASCAGLPDPEPNPSAPGSGPGDPQPEQDSQAEPDSAPEREPADALGEVIRSLPGSPGGGPVASHERL